MNILNFLLIMIYASFYTSILMSSETLFSAIALHNQHYEDFQVLAKNATVTITTSTSELYGSLTLDDDVSKKYELSEDTINNLVCEWNWNNNSKQGISLWRSLRTHNDLIIRLNRLPQNKRKELNYMQHLIAFGKIQNVKQRCFTTPNAPILLPKQQYIIPIIPAKESKYFSVHAKCCNMCDTSNELNSIIT
jgi:hypothetical protein